MKNNCKNLGFYHLHIIKLGRMGFLNGRKNLGKFDLYFPEGSEYYTSIFFAS